jgi:ABC-type amino acid transport substrate-binding protein
MGVIRLAATLLIISALSTAAGAGTIDDLHASGKLRIGVRQDAKPFSYYTEINEPAGYTVDLCRAVAVHLKKDLSLPNLTIDYQKVTAEDRFDAIKEGRIDLLCGATTITFSRREQVSFSSPVYITGAGVLFRTDGPQSMAELEGKKVGVRSGTTTEESLLQTLSQFGIKAEVVRFADHQLAIEALAANNISAYFADRAILVELMKTPPSDVIKLSDIVMSVEPYGLGLRRGDEDFRLAIDRALAEVYRSSELLKIYRANFGTQPPGGLLESIYLQGALAE